MKLTNNQKEVFTNAIKHFGEINQINKAIEEYAELIQELAKYKNSNKISDNLIEEFADVIIMSYQLKKIFDSFDKDFNQKLKDAIEKKTERLNDLIQGSFVIRNKLENKYLRIALDEDADVKVFLVELKEATRFNSKKEAADFIDKYLFKIIF